MPIYVSYVSSTEISDRLAKSTRDFWIEISCPSPTPTDTVIERDHKGNCIKVEGEYKKVRKRFYVEYDYEVFARWKSRNMEFIEEELQGRKGTKRSGKICIKTFTSYRPNFVQQTGVLTQFACDNCVEKDFVQTGLDSNTKYIHDCRSKQCRNYRYPMGDYCTCENCNNCMIIKC